jgi:hypothetical protein
MDKVRARIAQLAVPITLRVKTLCQVAWVAPLAFIKTNKHNTIAKPVQLVSYNQ